MHTQTPTLKLKPQVQYEAYLLTHPWGRDKTIPIDRVWTDAHCTDPNITLAPTDWSAGYCNDPTISNQTDCVGTYVVFERVVRARSARILIISLFRVSVMLLKLQEYHSWCSSAKRENFNHIPQILRVSQCYHYLL